MCCFSSSLLFVEVEVQRFRACGDNKAIGNNEVCAAHDVGGELFLRVRKRGRGYRAGDGSPPPIIFQKRCAYSRALHAVIGRRIVSCEGTRSADTVNGPSFSLKSGWGGCAS